MNDPERKEVSVETVLHGLRTIRPQEGIERRITMALAARQAESAATPRPATRTRFIGWRWLTPILAMAAIATLVIATLSLTRHPGRSQPNLPHTSSTRSQGQPPLQTAGSSSTTVLVPPRTPSTVRSPSRRRVVRSIATVAEPGNNKQVAAAKLPSFPAPPAPLTEQEKLLLRVARHVNGEDFAALNPEMRHEIAALHAKAFQQFFKPSALEEKINAQQAAELPPTQ